MQQINTVKRYLYLNFYAFLLLAAGGCVGGLPFWRISLWFIVPQAIIALTCFRNAIRILSTWNDKKRKYALLMQRNVNGIRPDTFTEYMQAPCGRVLVKIVLKDLGYSNRYTELKKLRRPLHQRISCKPAKTVVYINNEI